MMLSVVELTSQITPASVLRVVKEVVDESLSLLGSSSALTAYLVTLSIWYSQNYATQFMFLEFHSSRHCGDIFIC